MSLLDRIGRRVSRNAKLRGREVFDRGGVRILFADEEFVSAQVAADPPSTVDLENELGELVYSCDCARFENTLAVCEHVWAVLLELERRNHFEQWPPSFPRALAPAAFDGEGFEPDGEEDEDFYDADLDRFEDAALAGGAFPEGAARDGEPPEDPGDEGGRRGAGEWRHLLEGMRRQAPPQAPAAPWPEGRQILYVIERSKRLAHAPLVIQIEARDPKKNGGWKKPRPLEAFRDGVPDFGHPLDRDILARLVGVKRDAWYFGSYPSNLRFQPAAADLALLLPLISDTGRLFHRTEEEELRPLQWDGGENWTFEVEARRAPGEERYEIAGAFFRAGERLPADAPDRIFAEGVLLLDETLAPCTGPPEWVSFFRREGPFFVPAAEADAWIETMMGIRTAPPLRLPAELRLEEVAPPLRPIVRIHTRKEPWGAPYLAADLEFGYLDRTVADGDGSTSIPVVRERRRILRDPEGERAARLLLEQAGFRPRRGVRGATAWSITENRLAGAVRDLVGAGWHVEADGKTFRSPGALTLRVTSGIDWFELHGAADFGGSSVPIPRLLAALRRRQRAVRLDDGGYGMLPEEWVQRYRILAGLGKEEGDHVRFRTHQAGLLDALLETGPEVSCDALFGHIRDEMRRFEGVRPADAPPGFRGELREYQREGLGWFHFLERFNLGGCLADDMGLGKTIQVLALLEERRTLRGPGGAPSLVVMPRSLVFNWVEEARRFTPGLRVLEHTGSDRERDPGRFDGYDAVFTTYGTLRHDAPLLRDKEFDYVILDEAQAIKNASTAAAKAVRLLRARRRLALSGTPIENHLGELWSLFEFLNPGMLGSASVLRLGRGADRLDEETRALVARALRPLILRRTKAQVARDLPEKVEQTLFCQLEPAQRALYDELREHYRRSLLGRIRSEGMARSQMHILEALLRLRQAAIHPGLVDPARAAESSAKLDMLVPQLEEVIDEGHKALVFSQFTSMLAILRRRLDSAGIAYEYLDGQTRDRARAVERFQNDPGCPLFLISLKAGGLGLNLTAAEYVYLLDPWWNPAVEAQAVDRTHRIGQTRSVFAYRIIARDTVEEKVLALQESKREIADAIIREDNSLLASLDPEDLALLLD
jgi:superfamily II DNA or RNA helicase